MSSRSSARRIEWDKQQEAKVEALPVEDPRDTLLRKILGALNRMRLMPYPASARAGKEFKAFCKEYRNAYGHLTIPTSLPLRLTRHPVLSDGNEDKVAEVLPLRKKSAS